MDEVHRQLPADDELLEERLPAGTFARRGLQRQPDGRDLAEMKIRAEMGQVIQRRIVAQIREMIALIWSAIGGKDVDAKQ